MITYGIRHIRPINKYLIFFEKEALPPHLGASFLLNTFKLL